MQESVAWSLYYGQISVFIAALLVLALALRRTYPVCAGLLLALLTVKHYIVLSACILLLCERNIRTLAVMAGAVFAMVLLSILLFGMDAWLYYLSASQSFGQLVVSKMQSHYVLGVSVFNSLFAAGVPFAYALAGHVAMMTACLLFFYHAQRRGMSESATIAVTLCLSSILFPYSRLYDLTMLGFVALFMMGQVLLMRRPVDMMLMVALICPLSIAVLFSKQSFYIPPLLVVMVAGLRLYWLDKQPNPMK